MVDTLLDAGVPLEEKDKEGNRPLETAISVANRQAIEALLRRGARLRTATWEVGKVCITTEVGTLLAMSKRVV